MAITNNNGTRSQVSNSSNTKPSGVTKPSNINESDKYYSKQLQNLRGYSNNVARALQMMDLGFKDISSFKKTLSETDKLVLENEIALKDSITKLKDELQDKDKTKRKMARDLLQVQQKEIWDKFEKNLEKQREESQKKEKEQIQKAKDLQMEAYENSSMKQFLDKTQEVWERNDEAIRGVLGPLNLITKPFEEFFDFDLGAKLREKVFGGGKASKRNPTENDVAKIGVAGAGYLYIANKLDKIFGKKGGGLDTDIDLSGFGGANLSSIAKKILSPKGLATGSLIAGLGMIVYDAVQGYFMADEWDVGKVQATIGGALGGTGSGITNAFKKAGQYALAGAGAGAMFGPVGALVGGLGGLVIGAVGGYLGGEEISKQLQDATDVIFTDKTWSDVRSENLLADVNAKVESGELSPQVGNAYRELSQTMSPEEFEKLGKKTLESDAGNIADWIIAYGKGSLDSLSNENKIALLDNVFDLEGKDPRSRKQLLHLYSWIGSTFGHDENFIAKIFKDKEHTYGFLKSLNSLNIGKNSIPELSESLLNNPDAQIAMNNLRSTWSSEGVKPKGISEKDIIRSFTMADMYKEGYQHQVSSYINPSNSMNVNDAILRPDGSVIKTNPNDTLVALKDIPQSANALIENQLGLDKSLTKFKNNKEVYMKLDTLITLLEKISTKEPIKLTLPTIGRQDLDLIMNGGIL